MSLQGVPLASFSSTLPTSSLVLASLLFVVAFVKPSDLAEISSIETFSDCRAFSTSNRVGTIPWH